MSARVSDGPSPEDLDEGFEIVRATIGSTTYVLHELDITEYQKQLDKAKIDEDGRIDNILLMRLLVIECCKTMPATQADGKSAAECWEMSAKPPAAFWANRPTKVARKLNGIVNEMHYGDIETAEETAEIAALEAKAKGEASASGQQPT